MIARLTIYQRIVAPTAAAILLSLGAMTIVTFRGPPPVPRPLSIDDMERLATGRPPPDWRIERRSASRPAASDPQQRPHPDISAEIAQRLGLAPDGVRLSSLSGPFPRDRMLLEPFTLSIRQGDQWLVVQGAPRPAILRWYAVTFGLMAGVFILLMLPVRRVARTIADPIARLADAAERDDDDIDIDGEADHAPPEVRALVSAMKGMQRRIRDQERDRRALLRAIAHDLRTPMARLSFRVDKLSDDQRERAQADIVEMRTMIAAILDFMDGHCLPDMARVDAVSLMEAMVDGYREQGADVTLQADDRLVVLADATLLRRAAQNVIDNALRYAGSARILLDVDGGAARLIVEDNGPGIPPPLIARATEPFWREEASRGRSTGGMGLGLAIVQEAMAAMDGTLSIANRTEGGLQVVLRLPLTA